MKNWPAILGAFWILTGGVVAATRERARAEQTDALQKPQPSGIHTPDLKVRARDGKGEIVRSKTRRDAFMRATGYPKGRPGWVVDHVLPLACGMADIPAAMAWQTVEEAKAKDRWELDCVKWQDGTYLRLLQRAIDEKKRGRR